MVPIKRKFFKGPSQFIIPAFIFLFVFLIIPFIGTIIFSFADWKSFFYSEFRITGISNYINLFKDSVYLISLRNSVLLLVIAVIGQVGLGLIIALLLEQKLFAGSFFRGTYLIPMTVSLFVSGMVFSIMLDPSLGVFDFILKPLGLGEIGKVWLASPTIALWVIYIVTIWHGFGWSMFIFVSALKGISPTLFEAAVVDGASEFKKIIHITIPLLKNAIGIAVITTSLYAISIFEIPYVLTNGGPYHATEFLSTWGYQQGFNFSNVGYGAAISTTLIIISSLVGIFMLKIWTLREAAQE